VLATDDVGPKVAGAVADHGGEPLAPEDDAYLASFDGAGGAVAAAVVLTRSAAVRIGIHTGDAAHARRLAAACDLGSALVSAVTAALVDGDLPPGARLQPLGDRPLAGADPERLFELEHDPRAARQARERLLFNREQELGVLAAQLARARGGEGALVVVEGTAGIGRARRATTSSRARRRSPSPSSTRRASPSRTRPTRRRALPCCTASTGSRPTLHSSSRRCS
jgi:hypothetical protein